MKRKENDRKIKSDFPIKQLYNQINHQKNPIPRVQDFKR